MAMACSTGTATGSTAPRTTPPIPAVACSAGTGCVTVAERPPHGIGPHQLRWMPDGETLAVANGGIRTEADSREMLNRDNMEASLVIMGRDGRLISKEQLADQMNSVRHMAVARDGTVVTGQQYEGDPMDAVPLVAIKRPGQPFQPFPLGEMQRRAMNQYTARAAIP